MPRANPLSAVPPEVRSVLEAARGRIRAFVWADGLAMMLIVAGVAFWVGLGLDRWLEPGASVRGGALVVTGLVFAAVAYRWLVRPLMAPLSDESLALLLERHDPGMGDHLATVVSLGADREISQRYHPQLVAQTSAAAAQAARGVDVGSVFNYRPLWLRCSVAAVSVLSVVVFALAASETFGFWMERLALSDETWPRRVRLEVLGFPPNSDGHRIQTIARDSDFELIVRADLAGEHVAPERVSLRFRLPDGRSGRDYLARIGNPDRERDPFQTYSYTFKNVRNSMSLELVGGDDRVRDLQLRVVDRPELIAVEADCTYPQYLGRSIETLVATGGLRVPVGSRLTLRVTASKNLQSAAAESAERGQLDGQASSGDRADQVTFEYGQLVAEDSLTIQLVDTDGIESRQPYRLVISAIPDELPQIAVNLSGIGSAITPDARIPFVGQMRDDYGLREAWFEYSIDGGPPQRQRLERDPNGRTELSDIGAFDLRASAAVGGASLPRLQPGQKLTLAVAASDHCDLEGGPRVGTSQRYMLEVVTPADLLLQVERRELAYRQRFEAIYEKVTDTRAMLARVDFSETETSADRPAPSSDEARDGSDAPGEAHDRTLALRRLRVAGAGQNITQSADEVLNVAEGFENLHDQLVNNRIENRELMDRLKVEIATPLRTISQERMPELEAQLRALQEVLAETQEGAQQVEAAIALTDAVLAEMKHVLERMLELETYNEVVALLREIITDQRELNERTKEQRQRGLRSLLED